MTRQATATAESGVAARPQAPSENGKYPAAQVATVSAPPETENPADKFRRLLKEAQAKGSYVATAGAYDAFTAAMMTRLGFPMLYASG